MAPHMKFDILSSCAYIYIMFIMCNISYGQTQADTILRCEIIDVVDVSCFGLLDGQATLEIESTFPSTYIWSSGDTSLTVTGLSAGQYEVNLVDSIGNIAQCAVNISQPDSLSVEIELSNIINCAASADVSGGQALYSYLWSNGDDEITVTNIDTILNVVVTDANNCEASATIDSSAFALICGVCNDGILNGDETEIDCGGSCPPCDTTEINPLQLTKQAEFNDLNGNGHMDAGETISYTFSVCNSGDEAISSVFVLDSMVNIVGDTIDISGNECDANSFTATYEITEDDLLKSFITNSAMVQGLTRRGEIITDISDDPDNFIDIDVENDGEPDDPTEVAVILKPDEYELTIIDFIKNYYTNTEVCLEVLVVNAETKIPASDIKVNFLIGGQNEFEQDIMSDNSGIAQYCYIAGQAGLDSIGITTQGDTLDLISKVFSPAELTESTILVNNQIENGFSLNSGESFCDTVAIIYDQNESIYNVPVILNVTGTFDRVDTLYTDENGMTEYCISNEEFGTDTIRFSIGNVEQQYEVNWLGALGCTDILACNYDSTAVTSNGMCIYRDCDGLCPEEIDSNLTVGDSINLKGRIYTDINRVLPNAEIKLISVNNTETVFTDSLGEYKFNGISSGSNYNINADRISNSVDGVTTIDMLFIQRHILRLDTLSSPYKIIAADITGNDAVSVADIIYIRRLILGIVDTWGPDFNWRFIDANMQFFDSYRPWPFNNGYSLSNVTESECGLDLIAVKLGDVNNSFETEFGLTKERRSNEIQTFRYKRHNIGNDIHRIDFYADLEEEIYGFQLNIQGVGTKVKGVLSGEIGIESTNYSLHEDNLRMSWTNPYGQLVDRAKPLFSIEFLKDFKGILEINSKDMINELYIGPDFSTYSINILEDHAQHENLEQLNISPNPFTDACHFNVKLIESSDLLLRLVDVSGREIYTKKYFLNAGNNKISIEKDCFPKAGIYQYILSYGTGNLTGKLVYTE